MRISSRQIDESISIDDFFPPNRHQSTIDREREKIATNTLVLLIIPFISMGSMLDKSPYPILTLKYLGLLCPCLEKNEDRPARRAAWALSSSNDHVRIRWHRRLRRSRHGNGGGGGGSVVGGFLSSMIFGGGRGASAADDDNDDDDDLGNNNSHHHQYHYEPLDNATLSVVDSPSGPQLLVSPPPPSHSQSSSTSDPNTSSICNKKCIPLVVIKKVYLVPPPQRKGGAGGSSSSSSASIEILDANGRTLLRFDVLKNSNQHRTWNDDDEEDEEGGERQQQRQSTVVVAEDADDSTRNAILDHIHALIEWEQRRRTNIAMLGEEIEESGEGKDDVDYEYDDDNDDGNTMPISPRTAKKKKGMIAEQGKRLVSSLFNIYHVEAKI